MSTDRLAVWVLGDQLLSSHPALEHALDSRSARDVAVVFIESFSRASRLPYQRKKLVLLFSAMRHYAQRVRKLGCVVDYISAEDFLSGLKQHIESWKPARLITMASSDLRERNLQQKQLPDQLHLPVTVLSNSQFLVERFDPYPDVTESQRVVMEHFYRRMRRHFGILLDVNGSPTGGRWNYDADNRKRLPSNVTPPPLLEFQPDDITKSVMAEVDALGPGVGSTEGFVVGTTRRDAMQALDQFILERLPLFGPFEDAMSSSHPTLFHSLLSPYLNLGLLEPMELISAVEQAYEDGRVAINSAEGFIRQVLGWREFMYWQYWHRMPKLGKSNAWNAHRPLPEFFWTGETQMRCLRHAIRRAVETGYTHHIERLMLLSNFCLLSGVEPSAVNEWFLSTFIDAYEWVMYPNVFGMGLNADGGLIATKPYVCSANYINKMSDYCGECRYERRQRTGPDACPFNLLYWNFLLKHETTLRANPRLGRSVLGLRHLDTAERRAVISESREFLGALE